MRVAAAKKPVVAGAIKAPQLQRACACAQHASETPCAACAGREQRPGSVPSSVQAVLRSPGDPLDPEPRRFLESRFGEDFSGVRVHTDGAAAQSARDSSARAFTVGNHIVLDPSHVNRNSSEGFRILAHELAHTVQQRQTLPNLQRLTMGEPLSSQEHEAHRAAESIIRGGTVRIGERAGDTVQRQYFMSGEPAGGCGVCYGQANFAGIAAHTIIQTEFEILHPLAVPEFRFTSPVGGKLRPDLVVATPTGLEIGEIKPANEQGYEDGFQDMALYVPALSATFPKSTIRPLTDLIPPIIFPNPQAGPTCPTQTLIVNPPVGGVYGYFCRPAFSQLISDPRCKCNNSDPIPRPQEQEQEQEEPARARSRQSRRVRLPGPEVLGPLGVGIGIGVGAGVLVRMLGKRASGPAYAAAALLATAALLSSGKAHASIGLSGDDPVEALFKSMDQNGTPVPPALREAIESDPALRQAVEKAARGGDLSAAQKALNEQALALIDQNLDKFSQEDLNTLLSGAGSASGQLPEGALTVERIKQAIDARRSGATGSGNAAGSGAGTGSAQAPGQEKGASPPAKTSGQGAAAPSSQVSSILQRAPQPAKRLFDGLVGAGGIPVTAESAQRFLEATNVKPPLSEADVDKLLANVRPIENETEEQFFEKLSQAISVLRGGKSGTGSGGGAPEPGKTPAHQEATPGVASQTGPAPERTNPPAAPTTGSPAGGRQGAKAGMSQEEIRALGKRVASTLREHQGIPDGQARIFHTGPFVLNQTKSGFAVIAKGGTITGGFISITPLKKNPNGAWQVRVEGGWLRFTDQGELVEVVRNPIVDVARPISGGAE